MDQDQPLDTTVLRAAYHEGIFPMGTDGTDEVGWFRPIRRCVFPIEGVHVSRSLAKTLRRDQFRVGFDEAFEDVMWSCRRPLDNWITPPIVELYTAAHREGWGHSCEVWEGDALVGGTYGLALGGCFCAESMFHRRTDASKVALYHMVEHCRELGFVLFDAQIPNPHLVSMGAEVIGQRDYMHLFRAALQVKTAWSR
ncbi:MAG: leucyl/phenylalanyl-tRNA--protein transferase [Armatimonadetes bacterium]|nr:leucyl/phenylalanyl-tRNA--protein transferase [Armatimonadota bacterium]